MHQITPDEMAALHDAIEAGRAAGREDLLISEALIAGALVLAIICFFAARRPRSDGTVAVLALCLAPPSLGVLLATLALTNAYFSGHRIDGYADLAMRGIAAVSGIYLTAGLVGSVVGIWLRKRNPTAA